MERLKRIDLRLSIAGGLLALCAALYTGYNYAGDLFIWTTKADTRYATKSELSTDKDELLNELEATEAKIKITNDKLSLLRKTLPIQVQLRMLRGEINQLQAVIMHGEEHKLDTSVDKLRKQNSLDQVLIARDGPPKDRSRRAPILAYKRTPKKWKLS